MVPRALHSLSQHETTVVLNCVYAHQLYACVSKVCPKVSEKAKEVILGLWERPKIFPSMYINGNGFFALHHSGLQKISEDCSTFKWWGRVEDLYLKIYHFIYIF